MTKKFLHTDPSINGKGAKSEFLIPDIYNRTTKLIGLETLNPYEFGLVIYTGVDLDTEEVFNRANNKKSISILKRNRCKKIIANYLEDIKNLKIGDVVLLNEAFNLEKIDKSRVSLAKQ
ncbi:MAG: hypothetical protein CMP48_06185 [Rickettsiales bacterium]|nr:hypothetical protein [Rickettsiales bacterium]